MFASFAFAGFWTVSRLLGRWPHPLVVELFLFWGAPPSRVVINPPCSHVEPLSIVRLRMVAGTFREFNLGPLGEKFGGGHGIVGD